MFWLTWITLLFILCVASFYDKRSYTIPNMLFFAGVPLGLLFSYLSGERLFLKVICILILFIYGYFGFIGIGDIKMWMVITAFVGFAKSLWVMGIAAVAMLVYGLIFDHYITIDALKFRKETDSKPYAFIPFMLLGTVCVLIWSVVYYA